MLSMVLSLYNAVYRIFEDLSAHPITLLFLLYLVKYFSVGVNETP